MIKAAIFDMYETLITLYASPLYFSSQMAMDAGISDDKFLVRWRETDSDRTTGRMTFEEVITEILTENDCYSAEILETIVSKRIKAREECFEHLHPQIISMLSGLKRNGIKIGLISNCFSEEAYIIKKSILYKYFDCACLSYEQGIQKPDPEIFIRCMKELNVSADECLYIGDGGSNELEAARSLGMNAVQAVWYLKEGTKQPTGRKDDFTQIECPLDIIKYTIN